MSLVSGSFPNVLIVTKIKIIKKMEWFLPLGCYVKYILYIVHTTSIVNIMKIWKTKVITESELMEYTKTPDISCHRQVIDKTK